MTSTLYAQSEDHRYLDRVPDDPHQRAVVDSVLEAAGVAAGDRVLEIGAGRGRYTAMVVSRGLEVVAIEPDATLASALRRRFESVQGVQVVESLLDEASIAACDPFSAVMGFHVLHHLDPSALACLDRALGARPSVGAAFLEPNPLNPLYAAQIALHPAMRFHEERGLWRRSVGDGSACPSLRVVGNIGLLPPSLSRRLGGWIRRPMTAPRFAPWSAYRLIARAAESSR